MARANDRPVTDADRMPTTDDGIASALETSSRGTTAVGVFVQDQTTDTLTVPFLNTRAEAALSADTVIDSRTVDLAGGHGVLIGEIMELAETATGRFMQSEVLSVNVNQITLDQPVTDVFTVAGSTVLLSTSDLNVNGLTTPQVFSVLPLPAQSGDMVRVIFEFRDNADMDFTTFGGMSPLANGCVLRIKRQDGTFKNLFNFKDNGDIIEQCFDHSFLPNNGQGDRGFTARLTWGGASKHGVVIRLEGALGEELQVVIQDDLTALGRFHITAQGHDIQD